VRTGPACRICGERRGYERAQWRPARPGTGMIGNSVQNPTVCGGERAETSIITKSGPA
jgi:hypothetical protein